MIKTLSMLILFFSGSFSNQQEKTFSVSGIILSATTNKPLIGVSVSISRKRGTTTDTSGRFILTGLQPGKYHFGFRCPDFAQKDTVIYVTDSNLKNVQLLMKQKT